jgi:chromosome segregation ATPase
MMNYPILILSIRVNRQNSFVYKEPQRHSRLTSPDQPYDKIQDDLKKLQSKLKTIESKVRTSTTRLNQSSTQNSGHKSIHYNTEIHDDKEFSSSKKSLKDLKTDSINARKRSLSNLSHNSSAKSIKDSFNYSLSHSTNINDRYIALKEQYEIIKKDLLKERKLGYELKAKVMKYEKIVSSKRSIQEDYNKLQEDYHSLIKSFEKSEDTRKKQKQLITELKLQALKKKENCSPNEHDIDDSEDIENADKPVKIPKIIVNKPHKKEPTKLNTKKISNKKVAKKKKCK